MATHLARAVTICFSVRSTIRSVPHICRITVAPTATSPLALSILHAHHAPQLDRYPTSVVKKQTSTIGDEAGLICGGDGCAADS